MNQISAEDVVEGRLDAVRVEGGVYIARNDRGAQIRVGVPGVEGTFTPGELLHIAAATCAALSADHVLSSRLGRDFAATVEVRAEEDTADERYTHIMTTLTADMAELEPDRRAALVERADRAVDRLCTVGRTLQHGAGCDVEVVPAQA